jgi:hypothetical protein
VYSDSVAFQCDRNINEIKVDTFENKSVQCKQRWLNHVSRMADRAGIAQRYSTGLRAGWSGFRFSAGAGNFSLHLRVQNGSGAHPFSYPMDTRSSFPGGEAAGT